MPPLTAKQPSGFSRLLFRAPIWFYRARLGWLLGRRFLLLEHTGRKSGLPRQTVVEVVRYDRPSNSFIIASGWGEKSDWYRNIRHNPAVTVTCGRQHLDAWAERLPPDEATAELRRYAQDHPAAARGLAQLFFGRPVEDLAADFAALSEQMPIIQLRPRTGVADAGGSQ